MSGTSVFELGAALRKTSPQLVIPPFRSHPIVRGGHLQTLAGMYWPGPLPRYQAEQRTINLPDGDTLILHDDQPPQWQAGERVALLVHGLGGCHGSPYLVRIAAKLNARGIRAFRLDLRDCGAGRGLARQPYHAGITHDLQAALATIQELCPDSPIGLAGFSLGGNLVLKLLGEAPSDPLIANVVRAAALNPPIDLRAAIDRLNGPLTRFYDRYFVRQLTAQRRRLSALHPDAPPLPLLAPRGMLEFDDRFTAPASGFASASEYHRQCSSAQFVPQIMTPTLILSAADDPLIPTSLFTSLPPSPHVRIHIAESGGHLGYLAGATTDPDRHWMDWRVVEWLSA